MYKKKYAMRTLVQHMRKLSSSQFESLGTMCRHSNSLYNCCLYIMRNYFEETNRYIGIDALYKEIKENEHYKALNAKIAQQTMRMADKNYRSFFALLSKKKRGEYAEEVNPPKYKKPGEKYILILPNDQVSLKNGVLKITKELKLPFSYDIQGKIKQLVIKPSCDGYYTMVMQYEEEKNEVKEPDKKRCLAIDIGVNNLATCVSNVGHSLIVNGRPLKAYNQYYNKRKAKLQGELAKSGAKRRWSKQLELLTRNRRNYVNEYMNVAVRRIADFCVANGIGTVIIGYNEGWKQNCNMGKTNNQKFAMIPHHSFKSKLEYKCADLHLDYVLHEESYTSKCSFIDAEPMMHAEEYVGHRVKRGLFVSKEGIKVNADCNGAANILRKVVSDFTANDEIVAAMVSPAKTNVFAN